MSPEEQGKAWANNFDKLGLFEQLIALNGMYFRVEVSLDLKLQILNLLSDRLIRFLEFITNEEKKVQAEIIATKGLEALKR
jgi:hypothetical protein